MFIQNKTAYYIKAAIGALLLFLLWRWIWIVFSNSTGEYILYILATSGRDLNFVYKGQPILDNAYMALRAILVISGCFLSYRFFRALIEDAPLVHKIETPLFSALADIVDGNRIYIKQLDRQVRILLGLLLIIQGGILVYFLFGMPYHYDEMLTYMSFSGKGLLADITYYPVPNNHILYNIVASLFLILPIDTIIAIRLPNVLLSFITAYYAFKTASLVLTNRSAMMVSAIFVFSFPFIMYSVQARGYGCFMFFSVALLYSFSKLLISGNSKYLTTYTVLAILGAYTMPTFIYVVFPAGLLLFIYSVFNKKVISISSFFKAHIAIGFFTFLLYLPLFIANGWDVFQKAEEVGVKPIQPPYNNANVISHLQGTWNYLVSGINITPYILIIIVAAFVMAAITRPVAQKYIMLLMMTLLISPVLILLAQKSIPFPRTWSHLIFPLAIGTGVIAESIFQRVKSAKVKKGPAITAAFVIVYGAVMFGTVGNIYHCLYGVDYTVRDYVNVLRQKMLFIKSIQRTDDISFYLAEDLQYEASQIHSDVHLSVISATDSQKAELIISVPETSFPVSDNYRLVPVDNPYFRVYMRKDL